MNWRRYTDKLPVFVSTGILITGAFWYLRDDPHIRGEDIAELRAAVEERRTALEFEYDLGFWERVWNDFGVSRVYFKVIEDTSGGKITYTNGCSLYQSLVFSNVNYTTFQRVDFIIAPTTPVGAYFEAAWYIDGNMQPGRMIMVVGKDPPGGASYLGPLGDINLYWRRLNVAPGTVVDNWVQLPEAPRYRAEQFIVRPRITKAQVYDEILVTARDMATAHSWRDVFWRDVFWLIGDIADGDVLCGVANNIGWELFGQPTTSNSCGVYTDATYRWEAITASTPIQENIDTTATRSGVFSVAPGIARINTPFATLLFPTSTNNITLSEGIGEWWNTIGNGDVFYKYACESSNGTYTGHQVTLGDLNQAANVLSNMTRTIAVIPFGVSVLASNGVSKVYERRGNAHSYDPVTYYSEPANTVEDMWDGALAEAGLEAEAVFDPASWGGILVYYARNARFQRIYERPGPDYPRPMDRWSAEDGGLYYTSTIELDAFLPSYPSLYALTNGMIAKVRVFAVVRSETRFPGSWGSPVPCEGNRFTIMDRHQGGDYSDFVDFMVWGFVVGMANPLNPGVEIAALPVSSPSLSGCADYTAGHNQPGYALQLVAEVDNPTGVIPIRLGGDSLNCPDLKSKITRGWTEDDPDTYEEDYVWFEERWDAYATVYLTDFVVVVDWNFKHLVSTPYEPDPYTPEWLSTNSP